MTRPALILTLLALNLVAADVRPLILPGGLTVNPAAPSQHVGVQLKPAAQMRSVAANVSSLKPNTTRPVIPWAPGKVVTVLLISWNAVDGANVATVIKTTTNNVTRPIDTWEGVAYAGRGTNCTWTNDYARQRYYGATTVFTNL